MSPREIHSGVRFFARNLPTQPQVALPQPIQPSDQEIDTETLAMPQPTSPAAADRRVVTIYVRKGDHEKERIISVNPVPFGADPIALVNAGFALDGNSATVSVDRYTYVHNAYQKHGDIPDIKRFTPDRLPGEWAITWSTTKAVNDIERALVEWLTALGYEVKFG